MLGLLLTPLDRTALNGLRISGSNVLSSAAKLPKGEQLKGYRAAFVYFVSTLALGASGIVAGGVWAECTAYLLFFIMLPSSLAVGVIVAALGLLGSMSMEWVVLFLLVFAGYLQWFKLIPQLGRALRSMQYSAGPRLRSFISLFEPILPDGNGNRKSKNDIDLHQGPG